jgi:hypothetical protein
MLKDRLPDMAGHLNRPKVATMKYTPRDPGLSKTSQLVILQDCLPDMACRLPQSKAATIKYTAQELGLTKAVYSVNETIKLLSSSRTGLYADVKAGKLRLTKNGRKSLFIAADIAAFLSDLRNAEIAGS